MLANMLNAENVPFKFIVASKSLLLISLSGPGKTLKLPFTTAMN